jgi:hypothetical protein
VDILLFGPLVHDGPMIGTDFDLSSLFEPTALPAYRTLVITLTTIHPHSILLSPIPLLSLKRQFLPSRTDTDIALLIIGEATRLAS